MPISQVTGTQKQNDVEIQVPQSYIHNIMDVKQITMSKTQLRKQEFHFSIVVIIGIAGLCDARGTKLNKYISVHV